MGASSCTALVASSTLGAIWVGCEGPHWPTQCSIVAENAFFQCVCGTPPIWKCSCQIWEWPWGLQYVGPWPPWWPLAHLGPFGWGPQDANGPQSLTQAINLPFFAMAKLPFFCQKNWNKLVVASPRPCGCWGWLVGAPAPNLACPMPWGAAKNGPALVALSLQLLGPTSRKVPFFGPKK